MKTHSRINKKIVSPIGFVLCALLLAVLMIGQVSAAKPPIPAGCPGSNRDGPPARAGNGQTVCDTIPAGCPGSSHRGQPRSDSQCLYANAAESAQQVAESAPGATFKTGDNQNKTINDVCGGTVDGSDESVGLSIKIGCKGKGNPIADAIFAIIRILSNGVGLVIIASIIYGGIQYTGSRGDPQSTAMAVNRIRSSIFALLLYIFGYAILNYLIPAGFLG